MKLLFVALKSPLPADNGLRMRIWAMLRALAADGHETHLVTFAQPEEMAAHSGQMLEVCRTVEAFPLAMSAWSAGGNYMGRLRGLFSPVPYGVERFRSPVMAERIATRLRENFDAVIIETPYAAVNLPDKMPIPLIMDDQNIEHMILKRYLLQEGNPFRWAYAWLEWRKLRNWEQAAGARSVLVMVCSENDRAIMRLMCPKTQVMVVPNIIDVDKYRAAPPCDNATVVYLGGMDWFPNRNAVEFFIEKILPELRKTVPHVKFGVVFSGNHVPPEAFRERISRIPGVEFVEAKDVLAEVANAAVFVVPILIGSGTRFKILEAGAMEKSIVSTRVGAEGLEFQNGEEILLEDDPVAFAGAVAALLANPSLRARLGRGARRRVERQYSFEVLR